MSPDARPIAVVAALPEELRPLWRRLDGRRRLAKHVIRGRLGGIGVVVGATGDGAAAAAGGVERILELVDARALLGIGFAGGLDPALGQGALVVGREVGAGPHRIPATAPWAARTAKRLGERVGLLLTHERLAATPEAKAALRSGAEGALAVDLESMTWARAATERGLPWLVVRAIFDTATQRVPAAVVAATGPDGRVRRARLVRSALLRPRRLHALVRMGRQARALAERLADAAEIAVRPESS